MYASSSNGEPWQISTSSSTTTGPCGSAASHSRFPASSASMRPVRGRLGHGVEAIGLLEPHATLSWLPRTIATGSSARTRSMTALGSAP